MVHYGTGEILVGEIIEFVQRANDAGVDISVHTVPEGQHSFIMGAGRVPEADEAIEQMGRWVRSRLNLHDTRHSDMSTS
jgi:acetyl esterase/lipase